MLGDDWHVAPWDEGTDEICIGPRPDIYTSRARFTGMVESHPSVRSLWYEPGMAMSSVPIGTLGKQTDTGRTFRWTGTVWAEVGHEDDDLVLERVPVSEFKEIWVVPEAEVELPIFPCVGGPEDKIHVPLGEDGEPVEAVEWDGATYERVRSTSGGDWVYVKS